MALRDEVGAQLDELCGTGGLLDSLAFRLPGIDTGGRASFDRVLARHRVADRYRQLQTGVPKQGLAAVVTAGPPGAGKTSLVQEQYPAGNWRTLDADIVKDLILADELPNGTFSAQLQTQLLDGHPVMPRELAGLVHRESIIILDHIRRRCLEDGENIIIEGTLGWPPHGPRLLRELAAAGYGQVHIIDVGISLDAATQRTRQRWWTDRLAAINGTGSFGGRFTPSAAIIDKYDATGASLCTANARTTFDDPAAEFFDQVRLTIHVDGRSETITNNRKGS